MKHHRSLERHAQSIDRRRALQGIAGGFGGLALSSLLAEQAAAVGAGAPVWQNQVAKAKRVIFLFMHGGPSQVDTFDYKPELQARDLQEHTVRAYRANQNSAGHKVKLKASPFEFQQYGESGKWVSELFPKQAEIVDDLCFIQSMHTEGVAHGPATLFFHTGSTNLVRPSMGSWISYGLGTENSDLPAFITLHPPLMMGGQRNYGASFLPSSHQGTPIGHAGVPSERGKIDHLSPPQGRAAGYDARLAQSLAGLSRIQQQAAPRPGEYETAISSFELAAAMQAEAPELLDVANESAAMREMYGLNNPATAEYGSMCLKARKLSEAGVRFVQVNYSENHNNPKWDQHSDLEGGHRRHARAIDQPVAALVKDLKQRGLLEDTLVICSGEFGRTPFSQGTGRDHNPFGFSLWLAGGGVKAGYTHGGTDELGYYAAQDRVHTRDLHATMLHLLGVDHERLTYRHAGRDFRLTDTEGHVVKKILA